MGFGRRKRIDKALSAAWYALYLLAPHESFRINNLNEADVVQQFLAQQ